jgi:preprotein translocase subunit SecF
MSEETGVEEKPKKKGLKKVKHIYETHYKKLLIIPFLLLILAIAQIGIQAAVTGDFMHKDVNLKGGVTIEMNKLTDPIELELFLLDKFPDNDILVRVSQDKTVIAADINPKQTDSLIEAIEEKVGELKEDEISKRVMGERLGASFFKETIIAILIAFAFMGFVVFLYFRTFVPSVAVILAAFSDIVITLAIVNVFGMKIGMAGIAAFLMLIGYSVDTDILLSTRVLKRIEGSVLDRVYSAMKTGMTMNITTVIAVAVTLSFILSFDIKQVMIIVLIGLLVDLLNTWIQNVGLLRWYLEKKHRKSEIRFS